MKCENALKKYMSLDKHQWIPLGITLHLLACKTCRTTVRRLTIAESLLAKSGSGQRAGDEEMFAEALEKLLNSGIAYSAPEEFGKPVSMFRWVFSGIALIAGFTIMPFSFMGEWSRQAFGSSFSVPFYILCGVMVTAWCGMFIGTNIDFFVKKFGFRHQIID